MEHPYVKEVREAAIASAINDGNDLEVTVRSGSPMITGILIDLVAAVVTPAALAEGLWPSRISRSVDRVIVLTGEVNAAIRVRAVLTSHIAALRSLAESAIGAGVPAPFVVTGKARRRG